MKSFVLLIAGLLIGVAVTLTATKTNFNSNHEPQTPAHSVSSPSKSATPSPFEPVATSVVDKKPVAVSMSSQADTQRA